MMDSKLLKQKNIVVNNIKKYFKNNKLDKAIIGISGGIDSAVGLNILVEALSKENVLCYFIDINSSKQDFLDASSVCNTIGIKLNYVNLNKSFKSIKKDFDQISRHALGNIKSRLRMIYLYDQAFSNNGAVCSNSNLDELYVGYFTKYGDNACDLFILNDFIKSDIFQLAKYYKVPEEIINKQPSAGLYIGQTDEQELGLKYKDIDSFLSGKNVPKEIFNKIGQLHNKNKHKLSYNYDINKWKKYKK